MSLPSAAQKQIKDAEELHAKIYEVDTDDAAVVEESVQKVEEPIHEEPKVEEPVQKVEEPIQDKVDFEHKYRVLQGKYNAEIPRMQNNIRDLESLIAGMQKPEPEPEATRQPLQSSLLSSEEVDDYGEDMIDVIKRAAREEISPELRRLKAENDTLKEQLGGVTQATAESKRQAVFSVLKQRVPDWQAINKHPDFITWLQDEDMYTGAKRHDLLMNAFDSNNAARVVAFFQGYLNENALVIPDTDTQRQPQVDLNTLVAPGRPKDAANRAQEGDKRLWTHAQISKFYADCTAGRFRGKEKEKLRVERDIIAAGTEGRIR